MQKTGKYLLTLMFIAFTGCSEKYVKYYNEPPSKVKGAIESSMENMGLDRQTTKKQDTLIYTVPRYFGVRPKLKFQISDENARTKVEITERRQDENRYTESPYLSAFHQELFDYPKDTKSVNKKSHLFGSILAIGLPGLAFPYMAYDNPKWSSGYAKFMFYFLVPVCMIYNELSYREYYTTEYDRGWDNGFMFYRYFTLWLVNEDIMQYNLLMKSGYNYKLDFSGKYISKMNNFEIKFQLVKIKY